MLTLQIEFEETDREGKYTLTELVPVAPTSDGEPLVVGVVAGVSRRWSSGYKKAAAQPYVSRSQALQDDHDRWYKREALREAIRSLQEAVEF